MTFLGKHKGSLEPINLQFAKVTLWCWGGVDVRDLTIPWVGTTPPSNSGNEGFLVRDSRS